MRSIPTSNKISDFLSDIIKVDAKRSAALESADKGIMYPKSVALMNFRVYRSTEDAHTKTDKPYKRHLVKKAHHELAHDFITRDSK